MKRNPRLAATLANIAESRRRPKKEKAEPVQVPLFSEQSCTEQDIAAWLMAVPHMSPTSPRAAAYIRAYDVAGKVRAAKANGSFLRITSAS